jgi:hypothetical protein
MEIFLKSRYPVSTKFAEFQTCCVSITTDGTGLTKEISVISLGICDMETVETFSEVQKYKEQRE